MTAVVRRPGRLTNVLLVGLVVVMVNLPFLHSAWQNHRVRSDGVARVGTVTDHDQRDHDLFVTFTVARDGDQPAFAGTVRVSRATYATAVDSGQVEVDALPGSTTVWEVEGQVRTGVGLAITLVADVLLLVAALLLLRFGARLRDELVLVATEDLERCPPGSALDPIDGERYVVCGQVEAIEDDAVVLDLGDRRVRVLLAGHHNPAAHEQPVRATGTLRPT